MEVAPGAFHLQGALDVDGQREIFARCRFLMDGPVAAYVPVVRGGGKMHVRMLCLGRHWNGKTYRYESIRSDFDGQPAPPIPDEFRALARRLADVVVSELRGPGVELIVAGVAIDSVFTDAVDRIATAGGSLRRTTNSIKVVVPCAS